MARKRKHHLRSRQPLPFAQASRGRGRFVGRAAMPHRDSGERLRLQVFGNRSRAKMRALEVRILSDCEANWTQLRRNRTLK
jgi:hypothetical protein